MILKKLHNVKMIENTEYIVIYATNYSKNDFLKKIIWDSQTQTINIRKTEQLNR